ncbi:putative AlkP superfamily pyrophosphatase or phosphodiesterase [Pedobacter sp. AK017]|uniref:alkaline phosphatase family protein n=1 Tax=Pedobacter sp. AK017 TaxID=2723073 RepID=UPI00161DA591|nr:ectonucleotide pyrophosphatase/phosphodiesterase [Pedobacter sp. AK017]MBB5440861.1 putative AlkP superfamily pyrophosphatase or phosphodiesterase [Pedobacter sp. AK017]
MKINALVFSLLFPVLVWAQEKHVILVSIDGLRPEFYQGGGYLLPNLHRLMNEGVYAKHMKSVFPSYTYPSHVAMVSGAMPGRGGIYYNAPIGGDGEWYWFTKDIKIPTLWQVAKQAGLTTSAIEWPVSVGNEITYNIPEIWDVKHPSDRITEVRKYVTKGLIEEVEKAIGKLDSVNMSEENLSLDANTAKMAAYIFKTHKPNFMALHFACVDGAQHEHGRNHEKVTAAIVNADKAIGTVLDAIESSGLKENTTVLIVGDHGMSDIHTVFRPNMLIKDLPAKFVAAGGSAFLYVKKNVSNTEFAGIVQSVIRQLDALPAERRKLFRIMDRKELDKMGADSSAVMALAAVPGLVFSGAIQAAKPVNFGPGTQVQQNSLEGLFVPTTGGHHGYDPNLPEMYTGFIAAGAGINKGKVIDELCVTDIAPLIAKLLGLEFKTPDGKLVPGILNSSMINQTIK